MLIKKIFLILILCSSLQQPFAQNKYYFVTAKNGLVVREKPSIHSRKLGKFQENKIVNVLEKTKIKFATKTKKGFWYRIKYNNNNNNAYVFSGFLEKTSEDNDFIAYLKSKKIICDYYKADYSNFYLTSIYRVENTSIRYFFNTIKSFDFGNMKIGEKRVLINYNDITNEFFQKHNFYYKQRVANKNNNISKVQCEFRFDGGTKIIEITKIKNNVILKIIYSGC